MHLVGVSCVAALLVLFGAADVARAQTPQYSFTKIQFPGSTYTEATGINNSGLIVGTYFDATGLPHGFTYDGTSYTTVKFPGAGYNYVFGVSRHGHLVGSHALTAEAGPYHAFLAEGENFTEFDYPGMETDARAMNSSGAIVGIYNAGFGTPDHGFLKVGDSYTSIDVPGATFTYAFGLNDAGLVTGTYRDAAGLVHGFSYNAGVYTSINFPGASQTYVAGVNNQNTAVGWNIQGGKVYGFVVSQGGWSFRALTVGLPGAANGKPRAINDAGEVVGTYTSTDCPGGCGFVARPIAASTSLCDQTAAMTYQNGALNLAFTVRTSVQTTWNAWLFVPIGTYRLWTVTAPALVTPTAINIPISPFPPVGTAYLLSMLSTTTGGIVCADIASVNTAPATPQ
jgi:hypothetical protein